MLGKHRKATAFRASQNQCFVRKAQVSIEILLLAGAILFMSVSIFSYYMRISETTTAMELTKIEVLKWIDAEEGGIHTIEKINYRVDGSNIDLCIFTLPRSPELFSDPRNPPLANKLDELKDNILSYGLFGEPAVLEIYHNDETQCA